MLIENRPDPSVLARKAVDEKDGYCNYLSIQPPPPCYF